MTEFICPVCHVSQKHVTSTDFDDTTRCQNASCNAHLKVKIVNGILRSVETEDIKLDLPSSLDKSVLADIREAVACFNTRAYRANVSMCRRAIESLCDSLGAPKDKTLQQKIEYLKKNELILTPTYNLASGIRQFGNFGVHPQDDLLTEVDRETSEIVTKISLRLLKEASPKTP